MFLSCLPLYLDHEKSAITNASFNQKFIKTQQGFFWETMYVGFIEWRYVYCSHPFDNGLTLI